MTPAHGQGALTPAPDPCWVPGAPAHALMVANCLNNRYLSWDDYFMAVAFLSAQRSKDPNKQVLWRGRAGLPHTVYTARDGKE
jgi:hypothetical protein